MELYRITRNYMDFHWFCMDLQRFMLIYMHFDVFTYVFDVFMSLGWPPSVPQAVYSAEKMRFRIFWLCQSWKMSDLAEFQYIWILGLVWKDARRKIMHFDGTETSRSFTWTRFVNKTMNPVFVFFVVCLLSFVLCQCRDNNCQRQPVMSILADNTSWSEERVSPSEVQ